MPHKHLTVIIDALYARTHLLRIKHTKHLTQQIFLLRLLLGNEMFKKKFICDVINQYARKHILRLEVHLNNLVKYDIFFDVRKLNHKKQPKLCLGLSQLSRGGGIEYFFPCDNT